MGKVLIIIALVVASLIIPPATGSINKAVTLTKSEPQTITIDFWDCTQKISIKKEITLPINEWDSIKTELKKINQQDISIQNKIDQQINTLQNHGFFNKEISHQTIQLQAFNHYIHTHQKNIINHLPKNGILNNSIINAMCAINFELSNGTTLVLGLNTFVNLIGFDIISFHKGYSPTGIEAKGLLSQQTTPGEFLGFMFGFLGYWFGEKSGAATYSSVTVAGFTIITAWIPFPPV